MLIRLKRKFRSAFGGLWTDQLDAHAIAWRLAVRKRLTDQELVELLFWIDNGFLVMENAIDQNLLERVQVDIHVAANSGERQVTFWDTDGKHQKKATLQDLSRKEAKLLDVHLTLKSVQDAIFADRLRRFLEILFGMKGTAFQSLYFENGSEQGLHQDTAFVYVDKPLEFVASWIALENVLAGSGELIYYGGSHQLPDKIFASGTKALRPGDPAGLTYAQDLRRRCEHSALPEQRFLATRGDVLFWAADLAHGGAVRTTSATRRSLVTHYCPVNRLPPYAKETSTSKIVLSNGHSVMAAT